MGGKIEGTKRRSCSVWHKMTDELVSVESNYVPQ